MAGDDESGGGCEDVFREPLIRYIAYVGEIGRSLSTISCPISKNLPFFTGLTSTYILLDTVHKGYSAFKKSGDSGDKGDDKGGAKEGAKGGGKDEPPPPPPPPKSQKPIAAAFDRYTWHMLASLLLPSYTLGKIRSGVDSFMGFVHVPRPLRTYVVAFSALSIIPLIIKPIDVLSDHVLDASLRKIYNPSSPPPKEEEKKPK